MNENHRKPVKNSELKSDDFGISQLRNNTRKSVLDRVPIMAVQGPRYLGSNRMTVKETKSLMNALTRGICIDRSINKRLRVDPVKRYHQYNQIWKNDQ